MDRLRQVDTVCLDHLVKQRHIVGQEQLTRQTVSLDVVEVHPVQVCARCDKPRQHYLFASVFRR